MTISEVMTKDPMFCAPCSSAQTAAIIMHQKETGIVPVTEDLFTRKLVGVVTDRDLCLAVLARGRDPLQVRVEECMTRDPITCRGDEVIGAVLRRMREHQVRRVPVVDRAGLLIGIVSLADLVRQCSMSPAELFEIMEKICEPALRGSMEVHHRAAA